MGTPNGVGLNIQFIPSPFGGVVLEVCIKIKNYARQYYNRYFKSSEIN